MDRPFVSVFLALSLDGFIAGSDGDLSWLDPYATDSALETGYERLIHDIDTLLMGRNTYEKVLSFDFWPYSGKRVVVLTHRPCFSRHGEMAQALSLIHILPGANSISVRSRRFSLRMPASAVPRRTPVTGNRASGAGVA